MSKPSVSYFKKRYDSDPKFKEYNRKRYKIYSQSEHGRKVKRSNYDKYMETEHGYMTDKWNSIKGRSRKYNKKGRTALPVEITKEEFFEVLDEFFLLLNQI